MCKKLNVFVEQLIRKKKVDNFQQIKDKIDEHSVDLLQAKALAEIKCIQDIEN